jgi:galactose mutarotase-like enzyme
MCLTLKSPCGDAAEILLNGAELQSWRVQGVDLLWEKQPALWDQTAPVLFPVVGWTRGGHARVGGKTYPLSLHGFAWKRHFSIAEQADDFLRLRLEDDAQTRALYPFAFRFEVEFRLRDGALDNDLVVVNTGDASLPYACGLHPAFRWPLAGSQAPHAILFDKPERAAVPIIAPGGLFSARTRPAPLEGQRLPLSADLMSNEALCFLDAASDGLAFDNGAGARLRVALRDFPHIALWALPPAPFLCIEAWTGYGDPEAFEGELAQKPSMRLLAPGAQARHGATFWLEGGAHGFPGGESGLRARRGTIIASPRANTTR